MVNRLNSEMITLYQIIFSWILDRNAKKPQVITAANELTANMNLSQKRPRIKIMIMLCSACKKRKQVWSFKQNQFDRDSFGLKVS